MSKSDYDLVLESIEANLGYLHKQRWAVEAAQLRNVVRTATGADKERAEQALTDHYETENDPETSRGPLVQEAMAYRQAELPA